jgi:hypothetical protein
MLKDAYQTARRALAISVTTLAVVAISPSGAIADADFAKASLKKMSDYLASQDVIAFDYDATFEVVTKEDQKLGLASSGTVTLDRPDKIRATREGGFVNLEMIFDGKTLTLLGKNANLYTQVEEPGTIDHLVDTLRQKFGRSLPAADLLMSNPYEGLMSEVKNIKDLGSGVVGGVECDTFAFRTEQVDWQIWIAQGEHPYPCRYVISAKDVKLSPQYTVQVRNWRTGGTLADDTFTFSNPTAASKIEPEELRKKVREFPENFMMGEHQ